MERFTNAELADMHLMYGAAAGNASRAAQLYRERFPNREVPGHRFFTNLHRRLRETGSFRVNRLETGRPRNNHQEEIIQHFEEHPRDSTRSAAQILGISSNALVWRVLHEHHLHPYHFQRVQSLLPADHGPRLQYARWFLDKEATDSNFSKKVLFTDEACFTRGGVFNQHNNHHWSANNPHNIHIHSYQHRFSVNVWAGIVDDHLIGPYLLLTALTGPSYKIFL